MSFEKLKFVFEKDFREVKKMYYEILFLEGTFVFPINNEVQEVNDRYRKQLPTRDNKGEISK